MTDNKFWNRSLIDLAVQHYCLDADTAGLDVPQWGRVAPLIPEGEYTEREWRVHVIDAFLTAQKDFPHD